MKSIIKNIFPVLLFGLCLNFSSCFKDLDTIPIDEDISTSATIYEDPATYKRVLAKVYAGLAVSGQQGPAGQPDISGIDEGFSTYIRQYWKAQELTTDEAVIAWNDGNIHDYHQQDWDANNEFITAMYNRIYYQISLCNEFLRQTTPELLDSRNVDATLRGEIDTYRAEVRFMRSLSYWHALDMFRNVPFVTEEDPIGAFFPTQTSADALFDFIETELKAIESLLVAPKQNEYGRADQGAVWALLAKMYLNAETHIGRNKYADCITYCEKINNSVYTLEPEFAHVFTADNHNSDEIIFPVAFDGDNTQTWGGMTFMVHAAVGGTMAPGNYGIDGGWGGSRTTSAFVEKFPAGAGGEALFEAQDGNLDYPVLHVPGQYQGWDVENTNTVFTSVNSDDVYEGYLWLGEGNEAFKFAAGPSWDVNWGDDGADGTLEPAGADIVAPEPGYYFIEVDINALTYTMTKAEFGVIGSATAGGWDADTDMVYDIAEGALVATMALSTGEIKFRANDDWVISYGDSNEDGLLEFNGANIPITSSGTFEVKLYLDKPDYTFSIARPGSDTRPMFYTTDQTLEIDDISQFQEGYAITKFTNLNSDGTAGKDPTFVDTDFPLFRLADFYLTYTEAVIRGGGGDIGTALGYMNALRQRAYKSNAGDLTADELTLDLILDERARELYWECHRRTDLIRFGKFSESDYVWPWKGGVKDGTSVNSKYDVFPIPSSDLGANPNLQQNAGY